MGKFKIKDALDLRAGKTFRLVDVDPTGTPGFDGSKSDLEDRFKRYDDELYDLQERLFANGRAHADDAPSLLVVLQGMDTSGKGGAIRHVFSVFDPQGTKTVGFGKPTEEEMHHDFLWRIRKHDPVPGQVVAFDRSHYEDVLIQRVHEWVDEEEIDRRFEAIREYEQELAGKRVKILKVFLHISPEFQKENLIERTEREISSGSTILQILKSAAIGINTWRLMKMPSAGRMSSGHRGLLSPRIIRSTRAWP